MLRLPDVGPGYLVGDDSGCGVGVENASPAVESLVLTHWPIKACEVDYEKLWARPKNGPARGAAVVASSVYVFSTEDGARAGFQVAPDLLGYAQGIERARIFPRPDRPRVGDEAAVAFTPDAFAPRGPGRPGVAVFWRKGSILATVFVTGLRERRAKPVALALARRQEARIEKPTRLRKYEIEDNEVPLDDPGLKIPVYWLGREFAPRARLPQLQYYDVIRPDPEAPDELGYYASLTYEGERNGVGFDLWQPRRWSEHRRSRFGRGFWDMPCARRRVIALRNGYAEIFRSCAKRRARFVAFAHLPGVVVDAGSYCWKCGRSDGAYGSFKGLTAVVRSLHRRHKRF